MIGSISYLSITPLESYRENGKGKTTLTSFEEVLEEETQASESTEETSSSAANSTSLYKDPTTGEAVTYTDVAKTMDADVSDSTKSTSAASSSNTTQASSMKTTKYDSYFKKAAKKYGVSESLLKAIAKAESNFNARDVSSAGAMGVMQLMPSTAESLGVKDPFDPEENIMGGAKCIAQKLKEFDGDVKLALAAYNAGSGAVKRAGGIPSSAKSYVKKVLSYKEAYETAAAVG